MKQGVVKPQPICEIRREFNIFENYSDCEQETQKMKTLFYQTCGSLDLAIKLVQVERGRKKYLINKTSFLKM